MFLQRSLGKSPTRAERKIIPVFLFFLLATWLNLAENLQLLIAAGKHFHLSLLRSCTNCHREAENNANIFWLCTDLYHMNSLVHRKHHAMSIWGEDIHLSGERCLMSKVILFLWVLEGTAGAPISTDTLQSINIFGETKEASPLQSPASGEWALWLQLRRVQGSKIPAAN